jgi:putative ribosome biogenesis GTPase RsgA
VTVSASSESAVSGTALSPDAPAALGELLAVAEELGAERVAAEATTLAERLSEGRFFVACIGQFKRGKSTLVNALVGDPILPTGVVPVTSVVTVVRHGSRRGARVQLAGGGWTSIEPAELAAYVAEERNPGNRKGVEAVEVFVPSALLASGMCLVDTPGIGSIFAGSTRVTRAFVPHVDAALVVLGADPPLSGDELGLVEEVAAHTGQLVFVLNKADRLAAPERQEARQFAERVLRDRLRQPVDRLFEVSATDALAGGETGDWAALRERLGRLADESGAEILQRAAERGIARSIDRLEHVVDERHEALVRPLDESERRLAGLQRAIQDAERALGDLAPLFGGEQERLARALHAERAAFLAEAVPAAVAELDAALSDSRGGPRTGLRGRAMAEARAVARRHVERWLYAVEPRAEALYRAASGRFVELANAFLLRLRGSGEPALGRLPVELPAETSFRAKRSFYFTELVTVAGPGPAGWLATAIAPRRVARAAAERDARQYLERLIASNSSRVAYDLVDRLGESRRRLETEIVSLLGEISASAARALALARDRHERGAGAVEAELGRLRAVRARLGALRRGLPGPS